jgi:hypothetical protein
VAVRSAGTNPVRRPIIGDLTLDWSSLTCNADPDQQLFSWTVEPGFPSDEALRTLAAGSATTAPTSPSESIRA